MLRLYMDVNVKVEITLGRRRRGIEVVTAQEDGNTSLEDAALLDHATALQRVLFSQDGDLLAIARDHWATGVFFAGLIYGHQLAATARKYVLDLAVVCQHGAWFALSRPTPCRLLPLRRPRVGLV